MHVISFSSAVVYCCRRHIRIGDHGVCQSVTQARCEKAAERINVLFGVETPGDLRNILLDEGPHSPRAKGSMRPVANLLWPLVSFYIHSQYICWLLDWPCIRPLSAW